MSFVPLPWCTSQSNTSTRPAPQRSSARRAATAALLNRQKPIARAGSAWCPGGRCTDAAHRGAASPPSSASTTAIAPPAACTPARYDPSDTIVSMSRAPPPAAHTASIRSTYPSGCTASSASRSTAGESRTSHPSHPRSSSARSIATIRAIRSGCAPVSCSRDDSWRRRIGCGTALPYPRMAEREPIEADLAVVGAGAAGLYAALTGAREGARVALISATPLARTASYWAQGGLAAALAVDDSPDLHRADTERAGRGIVRSSAAAVLCREAPRTVGELERLGVHFDADRRGNLALGLEGGHSRRRVVHAGGSATGRRVVRQLSAVVVETDGIEVIEGARASRLWTRAGRCVGVVCEDGRAIHARAVILATGGSAALWRRTTNPPGSL